MKSKFKVYYYYQNITLWKYKNITKLHKKKWNNIRQKSFKINFNQYYSIGKYICHYKKLNISRLYYFKFLNKQILKKYFVNSNEFNLKTLLLTNFCNLERRLDFNIYKANFVTSLYEAKFFISKGYVFVNKKRIFDCNYLLKTNDLVEIDLFFFNYLIKRNLFINFNQFLHIRNLVIDYKTFSFIFLNKNSFFIMNYNNFIKKNYYNLTNTDLKVKNDSDNNFYKFYIKNLNSYLFLDKQKNIFDYNSKIINTYKTKLLIKFLKYKYNDFYFRNILLKLIFILKYNYLNFLKENNILIDNFNNLKNIFDLLYNNININDNNILNQDFFNYYYILIFNFYNYILKYFYKIEKNYYNIKLNFLILINNKYFSVNSYNYYLLINLKIFKYLQIKNKLFNYYDNNNILLSLNKNNNNNFCKNSLTKIINDKFISQTINQKCFYNSNLFYKFLYLYISSQKFSYKIYRRCSNFKQNNIKRIKIIKKIRKSFNFTYFNCNHYGIYNKNIKKQKIYNQLIFNKLKKSNKNFILNLKKNLYYPINIKKNYKNVKILQNQNIILLKENNKKLNDIIKFLQLVNLQNNNKIFIDYLIKLKKQLYFKIKSFQFNLSKNNNFDKNFKDIYLLYTILNHYFNYNDLNKKKLLKHINYDIKYKIHYLLNFNYNNSNHKINKYFAKKYRYFINDYRRFQLSYSYIDYHKIKSIIPSNIKSYFNINIYNVNNLKKIYCYYNCSLFTLKYSFYTKLNKNKFYKKYRNIYKSIYLSKRINLNNLNVAKQPYNKNNFTFNLNIIDNNIFNDNLFYIDLVTNLIIRKFNFNYNNILYKHYNLNLKSTNIKNFLIYKQSKLSLINKKNNNKKIKYFYKSYILKNFKNLFIIKYKFNNIKFVNNNNKLFYIVNYNVQNFIINYKIFNFYYGYTLYLKKNIKQSKIFIKFNKIKYINNIYKIYNYYSYNLKKYNIIKYIYNNYIFKEYTCFINQILTFLNKKKIDIKYITKLYYNLLFTQIFNSKKYDIILKNNFIFSKNIRIIINYFILINRFYK